MKRSVTTGGIAGFAAGIVGAAAVFDMTLEKEETFLVADPSAYFYAVLTLILCTLAVAAIGAAVGRRQ